MKIAATIRLRPRWTRVIRADSAISSSRVRRRTGSVVSEASIDPAISGVVESAGLAVVDDLAEPHRDDPVRIALGELEVVDGAQHRDAVFLIHVAEIVENDERRFRVETCHRFVGEKDLWLLGQGAGERDPLLLPSGQGVGPDVGLLGYPETLEALPGQVLVPLRERRPVSPPTSLVAEPAGQHIADHG